MFVMFKTVATRDHGFLFFCQKIPEKDKIPEQCVAHDDRRRFSVAATDHYINHKAAKKGFNLLPSEYNVKGFSGIIISIHLICVAAFIHKVLHNNNNNTCYLYSTFPGAQSALHANKEK